MGTCVGEEREYICEIDCGELNDCVEIAGDIDGNEEEAIAIQPSIFLPGSLRVRTSMTHCRRP
ncbi:hypothetical protein SESBI_48099 [Sesbania bispinosa]|nr:hypothetical protein SESBI_48099 [Sesbania bispinosa]